ncbi:flagellar biosynthetic protein FliR [Paenibacillus segetis]|uniref:Flagellar biosynthetic protein FliR n=1 Tax=Paenibacillus segetis TaxID=1325360 RepID=A0ABQ1YA89_9BACL|nr:flagellar biosynthetic protein FliR [Paenibacillus segetis]GGH17689.1 flagellar biosynthetic protein FliR [Paenibacillus segetis]
METILQGLPIFMLIFCRMSAFFVVAPIFASKTVPSTFKIGISAMVAFLILLIQGTDQVIPMDLSYVLLIIREVLIGLLLGFVAYLMFTVIQIAGSFIDIQIGFGIANVIDPMTGASAPVLGNFKYMFATLLFLSMNGHHYLLDAVIRSYNWIPLSNDLFQRIYSGNLSDFLIKTFSQSFLLAFQMAAPLVVALFLTDVALGFLARSAPQFNVFVIGIPLKIIVGLGVLLILVSSFTYTFEHLFAVLFKSMQNLLGTIGDRPK